MVQEQLSEYVSSQLKLGVSRDAIKAALIGAGWMAVDVEDTLKKIEGAGKPASVTSATSPVIISQKPSSSMSGSSSVSKPNELQSIRMSDLVSASQTASPSPAAAAASTNQKSQGTAGPVGMSSLQNKPLDLGKPKTMAASMETAPAQKRKLPLMMIVGIVLLLGFAGSAAFFYFENNALAAKVAQLGSASADVTSRMTTLTGQVQTLQTSNTELTAQATALTADNAVLKTNLSFAVVPPNSSSTPASETVSISGTLTSGKTSFTLTTQYGIVVFVKNAQDPKLVAVLVPLVTAKQPVMLTGTHVPGSQFLTVTAVNGAAL